MWWITAAVLMAVCLIVYVSLYITNIMGNAAPNSTMKTTEMVFLGLAILFLVIWVIIFAIEWSRIRKNVHAVLCETNLGDCEEKKNIFDKLRRSKMPCDDRMGKSLPRNRNLPLRECVQECLKRRDMEGEEFEPRMTKSRNYERSSRNFESQNFERPNFEKPNYERPNFEKPSRNFEAQNFSPEKISDLESRDFISPSF